MFTKAPQDTTVPGTTLGDVGNAFSQWLGDFGTTVWPGATQRDGTFNGTLASSNYTRVNINPTDCCPSSAAGTTRLRLAPWDSGFENLILAGCWTRTGLNTTCVEGAVMSGMQAARAISGSPRLVVGEDFMRRPAGASSPGAPQDCLGSFLQRFSPFMHAFGLSKQDGSNGGQPPGNG